VGFVGSGVYTDFKEIKNILQIKKTYSPNSANYKVYDTMYSNYKKIYHSLRKPYKNANEQRFAQLE
ncbi:MAG: hypothetical protein ACXAD7_17505, partial [Candidatus Kariarchaeaceae archaeon]